MAPRSSRTYVWDATATDGRYDFTVQGADGFVRRFAGTVVRAEQDDVAVPSVQAKLRNGGRRKTASIELKLINDGGAEVAFTITPNDFGGKPQTVWVKPGDRSQPTWPVNGGRYDFTVTAGHRQPLRPALRGDRARRLIHGPGVTQDRGRRLIHGPGATRGPCATFDTTVGEAECRRLPVTCPCSQGQVTDRGARVPTP